MGWEVDLCALPGDCDLEQLSIDYEVPLARFQFIPFYFRLRRQSKARAEAFVRDDQSFGDCVEALIAKNPGIEYRYCELDRRADWLRWLLQSCSDASYSSFAKMSIEGESNAGSGATSSQGFAMKRNSPETCVFLCEWLKGISERRLFEEYDPDAMLSAGLYKWRIPEDSLLTYECILRDFRNLKEFYAQVSARREAALVIVD